MIIFFLFIKFKIIFNKNIDYINIPFNIEKIDFNYISNISNFFNYFIDSNIYINLSLGTPPNFISLFLSHYNFETYLKYNYSCSLTYNFNNKNYFDFSYSNIEYSKAYNMSDNLKINNKYFNFSFLYIDTFSLYNDKKRNILGLKLQPSTGDISSYRGLNFISQLKQKNITKNYLYSFKFKSNNFFDFNGEFIIGKNIKNNYYQKQAGLNLGSFYWNFEFDKILYNNISYEINKNAYIKIEYGLIEAPYDFLLDLKKNFFDINKCITINENLLYIYCNENVNIKNIEIKFYIKSENYYFIFNYDNLFVKIDNKFLFLIISKKNNKSWTLGKIFLQKYNLYFNQDKKMIYWKNINNQKKNNFFLFTYKFLFILIIVLFIIILIIIKKFPKRKNIKNIIIDYIYLPKNDEIQTKLV